MSNGSEKRTPIRSGGDVARTPVAIGGGEGGEEWARDLEAEREEYEAAVQDLEFELARSKRGFFSRLGHTAENGLAAVVNWVADGVSSPANAPGPGDETYERTSYLDTAVGAAGGAVFGKVFAKIASKVGHALGREAADRAVTTVFKRAGEVVDELEHAGAGRGAPVPDAVQVEIAEEFASRAHHADVPEPRDHGDAPHGAENLDEPGRIEELDSGADPTWDPEGPWKFPPSGRASGRTQENEETPIGLRTIRAPTGWSAASRSRSGKACRTFRNGRFRPRPGRRVSSMSPDSRERATPTSSSRNSPSRRA
jgi:hypothetical protein